MDQVNNIFLYEKFTRVRNLFYKLLSIIGEKWYNMIAPSFVRNLEVISIAVKELTDKDQMLSIAVSEPALYSLQQTNGVVEFYTHEYLQECKNTITNEFESNPKVQDLRNLYKKLGNDSTVVELMGTLKETVRSYRDTLCAKI